MDFERETWGPVLASVKSQAPQEKVKLDLWAVEFGYLGRPLFTDESEDSEEEGGW